MQRERAKIVVGALSFALLVSLVVIAPTTRAQAPNATVELRGTAFMPSSLTVLVGTTVTWSQKDSIEHTVSVDENQPEEWTDGILLPMNAGGVLNQFEHTFENLGTTTYHCEVHPNMVGKVIVVESFDSPFVTVNANDANEFAPEVATINATEGVLWINIGSLPHTITFEDPSIGQVGILDEGEEIRFNFTNPGSFRYRCTYHSNDDFETGMVGKVVVGGNASFPTEIVIDEPSDDATVNGTLTVKGRAIQGLGQPSVTDVEHRLDSEVNWTRINVTDPTASTWTFEIDTTTLDEGAHTILVRARSGGDEVARDDVRINVQRAQVVGPGDGGTVDGTPAPSFVVVMATLVVGSIAARRRDSC
jgi:plastocyanin